MLCLLASSLCAPAVIVGGTSGTGNNNDSQAGLDSYLSGASLPAFPYWNNLVRVTDASGVYLGRNDTTMHGWVLSADHVTEADSIGVGGQSYTVTNTSKVGDSDLFLYEIGGVGDPLLPSLPTVPLASMAATSGETSLMFGRGFTNSTTAPYPWVNPDDDDLNGMRWGSNTVEGTALVNLGTAMDLNIQPYIYTDFDGPGDPGVTEYDAQGAIGDSGGGLFVLREGVWELAGIAHFLDDGPDFLEAVATGDGSTNPSEHGDFTAYSDVFPKLNTIDTTTGTLIPEPSTSVFILSCALFLIRRRR